jgi:hypothetical protein
MKLNSSDFSVIIQGPILGNLDDSEELQLTRKCIESVRYNLPEAEIILSTWLGSDVSNLKADKIVYSEDPGAITYNDFQLKDVFNNNNRQIKSTIAGLNQATRKYSIKLRPDFQIQNCNFINYLSKYQCHYKYNFFKERVLILTLSSRDPTKVPFLFSVSDLFQVGLSEDLKSLWNIPLQPEPITTRAYPYSKQFMNDPVKKNQYKMRYNSEQYIWYAFTTKQGFDLSLKYFCEIPLKKIAKSISSVVDNFVICEPEQLGVLVPDRLKHSIELFISNEKWNELYQNICMTHSKYYLTKHILEVLWTSIVVTITNIKIDIVHKLFMFRLYRKT